MKKYMMPLWMKYPSYPKGCMGWRMGSGEDYARYFYEWYNAVSDSEKDEYNKMFPEPKHWNYIEKQSVNYLYGYLAIVLWTEDGKPVYTKNKLIEDIKNNEQRDFLFFYGHQPSKNGSIIKSCFSQWWEAKFTVGPLLFLTAEQYMMMAKAKLFKDEDIAEQIKRCETPREAKAFGRQVSNFDNKIWNEVKHSIVLNANYWKFVNNPMLMEFLLSTGDKVLIEASPYDKIWGIGMTEHDEGVENPKNWKGENMLGFALMEVRDEIRRVYKNYDKTF